MHILLVHQFFLEDQQGGGSRWNDLARIWVQQGHRVTVLAGSQHYMGATGLKRGFGLWHKVSNQDGVLVIRFRGTKSYPLHFFGRFWSFLSFTIAASWAGVFYARDRYDLVLSTSPPLLVGLVGVLLGFCKKLPVVFEVRDLWPESAVETGMLTHPLLIRWAYWLERWVYRRADLIVVLTPAFSAYLIEKKRIAPSKILCIPNAADLELASEVASHFDRERFRKEHNLAGRFVVIYVGAHGLANHLDVLHDLAERLADTPLLFLLIGDGREKGGLVKEAHRRGLSNLRFAATMPKRQVLEYILASDMGLSILKSLPIFSTIYSNKTFDYLACRRPVLMAIEGVSRQLVEEAEAGIYMNSENVDQMAEQICFCMAKPEMLKIWGEHGYHLVEKYYNRRLLAQSYLDQIMSLANAHK